MDGSGTTEHTAREHAVSGHAADDGTTEAGAAAARELRALVDGWLPGRRWYPAKGAAGALPVVAVVTLADPRSEAEVRVELRRLPAGGLLQVPLVLRHGDAAAAPAPTHVVGRLADGTVVVDGAADPAFLRAWFAAAEGDVTGPVDLTGARLMTGEQSNTSVLLPSATPPAILKVFRTVGAGPNPDVEVPLALSRTGWRGVPRPLAWLAASWPEGPSPSGGAAAARLTGHLGVVSELVQDAQDGFELACRYARDDEDLAPLARELGSTTAQMHAALRTALPTAPPTDPRTDPPTDVPASGAGAHGGADVAAVVATLRDRAAAALEAAPVLADRRAAVDRVLARVEGLALPPLQRVHGDYHLGQVLRAPHRGWVVLDFEGEPQASASERTRPDLALRDLAGMLRSVDYAAAVGHGSAGWAARARDALVTGYLAEAGTGVAGPAGADVDRDADDPTGTLLHALELDKALYEVVYESRNRPDWVAIPLGGVDRLLDAA